MKTVVISVVRTKKTEDLGLPAHMTPLSAGVDLPSAEDVLLEPGEIRLIGTGLSIALPPGFEAQIRPRSGLAVRHGVTVINAPGTIDADYRGEIRIGLVNLGKEAFSIRRGDRIAQMVVAPVVRIAWEKVDSLDETARGAGGFGHTGKGKENKP